MTEGEEAGPGRPRGDWGAPAMAGVFDIDLETEEGSDGEELEVGGAVRRGIERKGGGLCWEGKEGRGQVPAACLPACTP